MRPKMTALGDTIFFRVRLMLLLIGASLVACALNPSTSAPTTSTSLAPTVPTRAPTSIPKIATRTVITATSAITLTLWTTEEFAPSNTPSGRLLAKQFDAFSAAHPNIRLHVVVKKSFGKGGLLDFLKTTSAVIPAQLPDLITLDLAEAQTAATAGLIQPLDGLVGTELYNEFFPFVNQASRIQSQWVSVPFAVDIEHLVYNRTTIKKVPGTWDEFSKQKGTLMVPVGDKSAFLVQYLALAPIVDSFNVTPLDVDTTAQVLTFFKRSRDTNLIPESAIGLKSANDAWTTFAKNQVAMAQVPASRYLAERAKSPNAGYAPVPTRDGKVATIANGWSLAIVTKDPSRQSASAKFIQWMLQGEHLAPWLQAMRYLPATRLTIALAIEPPDYATFVRDELERASFVSPSVHAKATNAWQTAITAVWKNQTTPEEAARTMADALK